jgi:hypothetical protein
MNMSVNGTVQMGTVNIATTSNTGLSVEYWAERLLDRAIYVGEESTPFIRDQALAYKDALRDAIILHMKRAIQSDRTTLYNLLLQQGETQMAEVFRKLGHNVATKL